MTSHEQQPETESVDQEEVTDDLIVLLETIETRFDYQEDDQ